MQATRVYYDNDDESVRVLVNRGGAGSSKSHSLAQLVTGVKFLQETNKKILIVRKTLPALKLSVYRMVKDIWSSLGVTDWLRESKVSLDYEFGSNYLHFGSVDDPEKIKSTEWNYIWMEEATDFTWDDFQQLKLRLRAPSLDGHRNQIFMSFNPIDEYHWIKEKVVDSGTEHSKEIVSTYKDNPFLDMDSVEILEGLVEQDPTHYMIYAKGQWGRLENLIYKFGLNWDTISWWPDLQSMDRVIYGMDFGFNAPSSIVQLGLKHREVYERELLYENRLTNPMLIERAKLVIPDWPRAIIYADSAEPDRIEEFKKAGFKKIREASKNVLDGIDVVKQYNVHVHTSSINLLKEKRAYSWRKDRNGRILDVPVEFMDHGMDAERYALYTFRKGGNGVRVRFVN